MLELPWGANITSLLLDIRLEAGFTLAATRGQVPLPVTLAQVGGSADLLRVLHAAARGLFDEGDLAARRGGREMGEVDGRLWAGDVVHLDSEKRNAGALIPEGEVHALLGDRYGFDLRVDVHFGVGIESALPRRYSTNQLVALRLPRGRLAGGRIKLVVQEREGLLAGQRIAGKESAVTDSELDLDVDAVGVTPLDEGRPQPVVHVVIGYITHDVGAPVDAFLEVGERLLDPPWSSSLRTIRIPGPFESRLRGSVQKNHLF